MRRISWQSLVLISFIAMTGCGAPPRAALPTETATASPTTTDSPVPTASQTASPSPSNQRYASSKWLYSVEYPDTWFNLDNFGAPDTQKYFSNEEVETPSRLDANGIWLTLNINDHPAQSCDASVGMNTPSVTSTQISIDGQATVKYVSPRSLVVELPYKTWCYTISFDYNYAEARDKHAAEIEAILSSFHFNR